MSLSKEEIWEKAIAFIYRESDGETDQPTFDPENCVDLEKQTVTFYNVAGDWQPIHFTVDSLDRVTFRAAEK